MSKLTDIIFFYFHNFFSIFTLLIFQHFETYLKACTPGYRKKKKKREGCTHTPAHARTQLHRHIHAEQSESMKLWLNATGRFDSFSHLNQL